MAGIEVSIKLDELFDGHDSDERPTTVADRILMIAAHEVIQSLGRDDVFSSMRQRVQAIRDEVIREALKPLVDDALNAVFQPTDAFGAPKGQPTSLREVIVKAGVDALTVPQQDRNGYRTAPTLLQQRVVSEVSNALTTELKGELDKAKAEVGAAVREQGATLIQQTIEKMANAR